MIKPDDILLQVIASNAFDAYNQGGPPERAGLTWDGKQVPPFGAVGASVGHKWEAAAASAALAGASRIIAAVSSGETDPTKLRDLAASLFTCPPFVAPT